MPVTPVPDNMPGALLTQAMAHHQAGRLDDAAVLYRRILTAHPNHVDSLHLLGVIANQYGDQRTAIDLIGRAIAFRHDAPVAEFHNNIGLAYLAAGALDNAVDHCRRAVTLKPEFAKAHNSLGSALNEQGRYDEAIVSYRQALALDPRNPNVHYNLGVVFKEQGRLDEAAESFEHALALRPDHADAHFAAATLALLRGDFKAGWEGYEWRGRAKRVLPRQFTRPAWDGGALAGRTILLHAEQGFGDTIQFIRYAKAVKDRGARVIIECQQSLTRLLATMPEIDQVVEAGQALPPFDCHAYLLSLPHLLGATKEIVAAGVPYLLAPPGLVQAWVGRGLRRPGLNVGLVWRGNMVTAVERKRAIPAEFLARLAVLPGISWVGLQPDAREDEREVMSRLPNFSDQGRFLADWAETAAAISLLDLVLTIDTGVAHLAGALGKPVWVMLPFSPDWRWLLDRRDSPWYPTAQLFRQDTLGDWEGVVAAIGSELKKQTG